MPCDQIFISFLKIFLEEISMYSADLFSYCFEFQSKTMFNPQVLRVHEILIFKTP